VAHWKEKGAQLSDTVRTLLATPNNTHPTRRNPDEFVADAPRPKKAREDGAGTAMADRGRKGKGKPKPKAEVAAPTAVAEPPSADSAGNGAPEGA
jgi:hypothetical protein